MTHSNVYFAVNSNIDMEYIVMEEQETIKKLVQIATDLENKTIEFYDSWILANKVYNKYKNHCRYVNIQADSFEQLLTKVKRYVNNR